ncbi:PEPxxWA-CTERM sorting domain-containing protein [Sandaracinobacteroides saxicola]|nr:PEPxxWA-CTERM sorting domain-containing protein [Sandaracinobacteroides saxicola]
MTFKFLITAAAVSMLALPASAATTLFSDRASFIAAVGANFVDTYETALGYPPSPQVLGDAAMSAVVGQTRYETTGILGNNLLLGIAGGTAYCSGCQGSFTLHFDQTDFGTGGVYGVALDLVANAFRPFSSLITFGDGSTQLLLLGNGGTPGITSDKLIRSIAFGVEGKPTTDGFFAIDNLTIASAAAVPEPATWAMMIMGFGLVGVSMRRGRRVMG